MPINLGTPPFNMNFDIIQAKVDKFIIDNTNTTIVVNQDNTFTMELLIPTLQLVFNFTMDGLDSWVTASSNGHLFLKNFGFKITSSILVTKGVMSLSLQYLELDLKNDTIDFFIQGTNDWIKLVNISVGAGLPFIIKEIGGVMAPSLLSQLQNAINGMLASTPTIVEMPMNLSVNYGLVSGLKTSNSALQVGINGTVFTNNVIIPIRYPTNDIIMPTIVPGAGDMQFFVSQYMIECMLFAIYSQNKMNLEVSNVSVGETTVFVDYKFVGVFIPEVIALFNGQKGKITLNVTIPPTFQISPQAITMYANTEAVIYLGGSMVTDVDMQIAFQVSCTAKNGALYGEITGSGFSLSPIKSDPRIVFNTESISQLFNTVLKFAIPQINSLLSAGFALPSVIGLTFKNSTISQNEKYIVIGTSPVSSTRTYELVQESMSRINVDLLREELQKALTKEMGKVFLLGI